MADPERLPVLLARAASLPEAQQRRVAAILGAVVADASAQPTHWIYDVATMEKVLASVPDGHPEFITPSANPYYCLPTGSPSAYGDQTMVTLESLVASKGYDEADLRRRYFEAFGPGSAYDSGTTGSASYVRGEMNPEVYPIKGKWLNWQTRRFVECHMENKTVDDIVDEDMGSPNSVPRLIGLVALYAGTDMFLDVVRKALFIFQTFDMSVTVMMATLRIVEQYILHGNSKEHLVEGVIQELKSPQRKNPLPLDRAVAGHFQAVIDNKHLSVNDATEKFGKH